MQKHVPSRPCLPADFSPALLVCLPSNVPSSQAQHVQATCTACPPSAAAPALQLRTASASPPATLPMWCGRLPRWTTTRGLSSCRPWQIMLWHGAPATSTPRTSPTRCGPMPRWVSSNCMACCRACRNSCVHSAPDRPLVLAALALLAPCLIACCWCVHAATLSAQTHNFPGRSESLATAAACPLLCCCQCPHVATRLRKPFHAAACS